MEKIIKTIWLFFVMLIAIFGCKKDDSLMVTTGVVFIKKKIDNNTVYGVAYYSQANQALNSVTVTLPNEKVVTLKQLETSGYVYWHEPGNSEFSTTKPAVENYIFKIESKKGEYLEILEEQKLADLGFAEIEEMNFVPKSENEGPWLEVKWKSVPGADTYAIMLLKLSGETFFVSFPIPAEKKDYKISDFHTTGEWNEFPKKGQKYILKINAIKYDDDPIKKHPYNIQEVSETLREIIWELE